jgi:hypothetical protein
VSDVFGDLYASPYTVDWASVTPDVAERLRNHAVERLGTLNAQECATMLRAWLTALTFSDCSVMITFRVLDIIGPSEEQDDEDRLFRCEYEAARKQLQTEHAPGELHATIEGVQMQILYRISVIDVKLKDAEKILKKGPEERVIVEAVIKKYDWDGFGAPPVVFSDYLQRN